MTILRKEYPIEALAQALEVSASGYYSHQHKDQGPRAQQDRVLEQQIQQTFQASRATYGSPRIHACLQRKGFRHGKNRVARLMRRIGLRARQKRRFVPRTTRSDHDQPIAPNWLAKFPPRTDRTRSGWWTSPISPRAKVGFIWPSFWMPARARSSAGLWELPWIHLW